MTPRTTINLAFATRELRDICCNETLARQKLGDAAAEKLITRLADLRALSVVSDLFLLPGRPRELNDENEDHMQIELGGGVVLKFVSGHKDPRIVEAGKEDWERIWRIKIVGIQTKDE